MTTTSTSSSAVSNRPIEIIDLHPPQDVLRDLVLDGLRRDQKIVHTKLHYDERGSELFERICETKDYYLTRTERGIFDRHLDEMARAIGSRAAIIEYGSGNGEKARMLLEALDEPAAYLPIEISREFLQRSVEVIQREFGDVKVIGVCADYTQSIDLPPDLLADAARRVAFLPGSTIGNFHLPEAMHFLQRIARLVGSGGGLLIGADLVKDTAILEAAYNDSEGVTHEFNMNLLDRLNRELDADFDREQFDYRATYNAEIGRIESYLISRVKQTVTIDGEAIDFAPDEHIRVECSYKYTPESFSTLARAAGFHVERMWTDSKQWFSVQLLINDT